MKDGTNKKERPSTLRAFAGYYKGHIPLFTADMICALMISLVDLAFPLISRYAIQQLLPDKLYVKFFIVMLALLGTYLLRALFQYFVHYWGHTLGVRIEAEMRQDLFSHMQKLPFKFYDKHRTGQLMSRVTNDLFEITELAHHGPEDVFISVITLVGSLVVMFSIQWRLALVMVALVPITMFFAIRRRKKLSCASTKVKERTADINTDIESSISGMRTAKAFANEHYEMERFSHGNKRFRGAKQEYYKEMGVFHAGMDFFTNIMNLAVIAVGGILIMKNQFDVVDLLTFTLYVGVFLQPIRRLTNFIEQFTVGIAGFKRFQEIMYTQPEITDGPNAIKLENVVGDIRFENVTFSYNQDINVLSNVNLHIHPGQTLALVGPSGGGKTTLAHLIPRFYEIDEGSIKVDGHDIREVTIASLRTNIGIVQQDVMLFADTVMENIRYGRITASDEEVIQAAKKAEIHEDIIQLTNGYDTFVGERGVMLSGGQKQRVAIARIFLKNPPILILDEATSALDTVTEVRIQNAFDELSKGRTSIVIAHRLSTIRDADEIAFIDAEKISERGSHEKLMELDGNYAQLYKTQFGKDQ